MSDIRDQPAPIQNELPAVQDLVIADIEERKKLGLERYGTLLKPNNGRNALVDLYQELLDAVQYLRQRIEEDRLFRRSIVAVFNNAGLLMPPESYEYTNDELFLRDIGYNLRRAQRWKMEGDNLARERIGEVWHWSTGKPEDGDNADTITCPIIIQPESLRAMITVYEHLKDDLARVIYVAEKHGWDGVANSKILWQFLDDEFNNLESPVPMVIHCPLCGLQHIDEADPTRDWTNPPHKSHLCKYCGYVWRPSDRATEGIEAPRTRGNKDNGSARIGKWATSRLRLEDRADGVTGRYFVARLSYPGPYRSYWSPASYGLAGRTEGFYASGWIFTGREEAAEKLRQLHAEGWGI